MSQSESLDEIKKEAGDAPPKKWGGARKNAGRKRRPVSVLEGGDAPAADGGEPEYGAKLLADLDEQLDQALHVLALVPCFALKIRPLSTTEAGMIATTAKPVVTKYIGGAAGYLGPEGVLLLTALMIYGNAYRETRVAMQASAHRGPVGSRQDVAGSPDGSEGAAAPGT